MDVEMPSLRPSPGPSLPHTPPVGTQTAKPQPGARAQAGGQGERRGAHLVLTPALTTESPEQSTGTALATAQSGLSHWSATTVL